MCPEMLAQEGHGFALDYYCLGVLLYELLTGLPPHYSEHSRLQMYQNIATKAEAYPKYLSKEVVQLLKGLLRKEPGERLQEVQRVKEEDWL